MSPGLYTYLWEFGSLHQGAIAAFSCHDSSLEWEKASFFYPVQQKHLLPPRERMPSSGWDPVLGVGDAVVVCVCHGGKCVNGINLGVKTQGRCSQSLTASPSRHPATTRSFFRAGVLVEAGGSVGGQFPATPPQAAVLPASAIGCPSPGAGTGQQLKPGAHSLGHPNTDSQLAPSQALEETPACTMPQATRTTTDMRAVFLVLLFWATACAHPVPGHEPTHSRRRALQEDTASEDYINKLGNLLGDGDVRHPPANVERGDNALARDPAGGNTMGEELGEQGDRDKRGRVGKAQHLNRLDHEDTSALDGNSLGFLEEDARDADDGEHHGTGVNGLPSHAGGLLDEEDDSGDDTFDEDREEEGAEGPTYVAGADGAGEHGHDTGRVDTGAGGGRGDSSSSSSSESVGADHWRHRNYLGSWYERTYRQGGHSSSSQEEESYDFEDEAMQGDDPSVFDGPGNSYRGHRAGPRTLGSSRESSLGAGSHRWEEGDSRSPEVEDADSREDSPSTEDNSQLDEPVTSQSEENSASHSEEDGDGEDSPSKEDTTEQSDEEPGESSEDISPEVVSKSSEHSSSWSQEGQEDQESAEDTSVPSAPDSESREDEDDQSKSTEDDGDQSQSTEDTVEESKEDENDSDPDGDVLSTSEESQSASPEDDHSQEDNAGEDSRSTESNNSESQEEDDDDDDEESHSQEDASHESSSRGDNSSPQSLESGSRKRRPGAYRNKPAADYDDNDCQDGY
ncbi:LOW QUALITY PROTEIN: dentin matrix acidic phosphoprotein 1 [Podargus strigoides]